MPRVVKRAQVPYSPDQMFALVNDVESYPEFLHWCRDARIVSRFENGVEAALDIGIRGIHKTFRTRNTLLPPGDGAPGRIDIALVSGPFRKLEGAWTFTATEGGCEVRVDLDYEISSMPLGTIFSAVFEEIARSQINAFVRRAAEVYRHG